ncbi:PepSY domain-containing protein [Sphingomonas sp. Leaf412]|uniref:PepSY domain-containing protein n=1 Tax=Sphingomonas sp. Leaf412 TaxID=1736370 RepID=UPI000A67C901|nr:PepSY domain-containing protein [Sphingomonas sp. Leaf412]
MKPTFLPCLPLVLAVVSPAAAAQGRDSVAAWQATRTGKLLPLKEIERRVVPTMKGAQYIGFDLELPSGVYTLKFLRDGNVIWVDVDGRTGKVLGQTGR